MEEYKNTVNSEFEFRSKPLNYAGFWIRLGARLIDGIITYVLFMALTELFPRLAQQGSSIEITYGPLVVGILYYTVLESSSMQASVGKQVFKLKVIDEAGKQLSMPKALLRTITKEIGLMFLIGGLMVGFTDKKRGLHDVVAKTFVVKNP
ncbi:MAG: RDD family protein [Methanosarcinaceae archaeon]|nr:RDD family protein [Methanosarcinaceae archaeon]